MRRRERHREHRGGLCCSGRQQRLGGGFGTRRVLGVGWRGTCGGGHWTQGRVPHYFTPWSYLDMTSAGGSEVGIGFIMNAGV